MTKVNVEGLERGEVLAALYNSSKPQGLGIASFIPGDIRASEAEYMFLQGDYFDYLNGRVIKTKIKRGAESIDATLYDRDNGEGAAERAIAKYRQKKECRCPHLEVPLVFMRAKRENWEIPGVRGFKFDVMGGVLRVWEDFRHDNLAPVVFFEFQYDDKERREYVTARYACHYLQEGYEHFNDCALRVIFEVCRGLANGK